MLDLLKQYLDYVKQYGFATVVAGVLLYVLLFRSPDVTAANVKAQTDVINQTKTTLDTHVKAMNDSIENDKRHDERMLRFMYLMCLNTARDQGARDACEAVMR